MPSFDPPSSETSPPAPAHSAPAGLETARFDARLAAVAAAVEDRLAAELADRPAPAAGFAAPERLLAAMRHACLGGGKRFRPFLVVETARLFGGDADAALAAGAAVECLHCYSLVHDDLPAMDDDDLRRGRPTVHKAFDEATAILAGDALLTLSFEILARPHPAVGPAARAELVRLLAVAAGPAGMVGGQMLDLAAEGTAVTEAEVARLQAMKTGALIVAAAEMGAVVAGAGDADRRRVVAYARALGLAFQLADDLLDAEGSTDAVGKRTGKDDARGKATLVALNGVAWARTRLAGLVAEAEAALAPYGDPAGPLAAAARFAAARTA